MKKSLKFFLLLGFALGSFSQKPNIVFILTDDQDSEMDSVSAMPKLRSLVGDKGATFVNSFAATPLCCPSRSGILTGQYVHNHGTLNNSIEGGCSSTEWQNGPELNTFPILLNNDGYTTFFAGKYLNNYGFASVGGLEHVPAGWNSWIGLLGNSVYYNYYLSVNGTSVFHGNKSEDYLTNVIKNEALKFIETIDQDNPFFMMLSTPAAHAPFTPEPQYSTSLNDTSIPRHPNFNIVNENKNWFVQFGEQPLKPALVDSIEAIYRDRLRTLLTVDDMVESVVQTLESKGYLNNTYVLFTSDHGYHLGQFSLHKDKREPYEFDIKVPFMVRGPGISEGIQIDDVITNIDLAPTFLDLVGVPIPINMDGISFKDSLHYFKPFAPTIERTILIEHSGEGSDIDDLDCSYLGTGFAYCESSFDCRCQDASNNTYNCLRTLGNDKNDIYCYWEEYDFEEYYNIATDPYQLTNGIDTLNIIQHNDLKQKLSDLMQCSGASCNSAN